jgi:large subunit ribosomal protein L13Ae
MYISSIAQEFVLIHASLEERRKVKGSAYYERKKAARRQMAEAKKSASVDSKTQEHLTSLGY